MLKFLMKYYINQKKIYYKKQCYRRKKVFIGKEIKLNKEAFDTAIARLTEYNKILTKAKEQLILTDKNIKEEWLGAGGNSFLDHTEQLEKGLNAVILDIETEIKDLRAYQKSMFNLDQKCADSMQKYKGLGSPYL